MLTHWFPLCPTLLHDVIWTVCIAACEMPVCWIVCCFKDRYSLCWWQLCSPLSQTFFFLNIFNTLVYFYTAWAQTLKHQLISSRRCLSKMIQEKLPYGTCWKTAWVSDSDPLLQLSGVDLVSSLRIPVVASVPPCGLILLPTWVSLSLPHRVAVTLGNWKKTMA